MGEQKLLLRLMCKYPDFAKERVLTDEQIKVLEIVKSKDCLMSRELAGLLGITVTAASQRLRILLKKGYLQKRQITEGTHGGYIFVYSIID